MRNRPGAAPGRALSGPSCMMHRFVQDGSSPLRARLSKRRGFPGGALGIPEFQQLGLPRSPTQTEGLLVSHLGSRDFFKNYCSENIAPYLLIICFNVVSRNHLKKFFSSHFLKM